MAFHAPVVRGARATVFNALIRGTGEIVVAIADEGIALNNIAPLMPFVDIVVDGNTRPGIYGTGAIRADELIADPRRAECGTGPQHKEWG